jgi:hypothetical protein
LKIQQWISGKELMERWQIKPLDLVDIVLYEKLPVYEPDGRLAEYEHEDAIRANHPSPFPLLPRKDDPTIYDLILNAEAYDFKIPPIHTPTGYIPLVNKIEQCMFKLTEIERLETTHNIILQNVRLEKHDIQNDIKPKRERKKGKRQICREKVREKAREIWDKEPSITIEAMSISDDVTNITLEQCGTMFVEKTVRGWIKDLCPNRSPGRRPDPEKKSIKSTKMTEG